MKNNFGSGLITAVFMMFGINAYGQAPVASPAPNPTGGTEQGGELQQITVTGYIIPRVGDGPQPVVSLDRNYIEKTGSQTVTDVIQNLPSAVGAILRRIPRPDSAFLLLPLPSASKVYRKITHLSWSMAGGCRPFRSIKSQPPVLSASLTSIRFLSLRLIGSRS